MINRLEEAIWARDLTIRQLCIRSGVSKSTIGRLMKDKTTSVSMEAGLKICKALGADPRDIFII